MNSDPPFPAGRMDIRIQTFGRFAVFSGDRELTQLLDQPIRAALLVYLAVEGQATRDAAEAIVWSDLPPEKARHALNQTLYRLRKDLGEEWIDSDGDRLQVTGRLRIDTREFEKALADGRLDDALALYEGGFLETWHLLDTSAFEHWTDRHRLRLSRLHREANRTRIAALKAEKRLDHALEVARAWVRKDQLEDEAHHLLIELLARTGHRSEALERFEALTRVLAEEDLTPLEETEALVRRLKEGKSPPGWEEAAAETSTGGPVPSADRAGAPAPPASEPGCSPRGRPVRSFRMGPRALLLATIPLVLLGAGVFALSHRNSPRPGLKATRVLVAPLENQTGDPSLDPVGRLAADWITQGLGVAEFLQVIPFGELMSAFATQSDLESGADHLSRALAAAEENGAGTLVTGTYYAAGPGLEFHVRLLNVNDRGLLEGIGPVRSSSSDPMEVVDVLRQRVLVTLAVLLDERIGGILNQSALPPSYPAYLAYFEGARKVSQGDWAGSIPDMVRAHELSPEFVSPLIFLGFALMNARGDYAGADSVARIIEAARASLPRYDRLRLDFLEATLRGDNAAGYQALREAADITPGGTAQYAASQKALELNRPREALEILSTWDPTREMARQWVPYWNVFTQAHHLLGNHREELDAARRGRRQIPDQLLTLAYEVRALAALGRSREAIELLGESLRFRWRLPGSPGSVMLMAAEELRAHGHPEEAAEALGKALQWVEGLPAEERSSEAHRLIRARALYLGGQYDGARETFLGLLADNPEDPVYLRYLGAIAARTGDRALALEYSDALAGLDRPYLFGQHTLGRAAIGALLGEEASAVALLQTSLSQGVVFGTPLHSDPDLQSLRSYPPFEALLEPTG